MDEKTRDISNLKLHHFAGSLLMPLLFAVMYFTCRMNKIDITKVHVYFNQHQSNADENSTPGCNLFQGRWVYDNVSYPLYREHQCNSSEGLTCGMEGRKDLKFQNWRWQPHQCDLPRFDARAFLEKIRDKTMVFVGDSLNRNQWRSMLCLIQSSVPSTVNEPVTIEGNFFIFQATEYNALIKFYWSPFLVESNCDNLTFHRVQGRKVIINAIEKHAQNWIDADILIFDSFIWWADFALTSAWGSFRSYGTTYIPVAMPIGGRYELGLRTWSDWLEFNVNRTRTRMYFMSASSYHCSETINGVEQHCYDQTEPILTEGLWGCPGKGFPDMMRIAESAIEKLQRRGINLQYLNISQLSGYRKDAHVSIYKKFHKDPSERMGSSADCLHWCLPGVPDVWNQILYAYIMNPHQYQ